MDRTAIAKRLEGLSKVFASGTPYHRDLKAMAEVLTKVEDEKFKTILSSEFTPDVDASEDIMKMIAVLTPEQKKKVKQVVTEAEPVQAPAQVPMGAPVKQTAFDQPRQNVLVASTESTGMFWSKEASEAVLNNLVRDVVGMDKSICCDTKRHLDKGQVPDGTHNGEKASNLKPEQTPDQKDVLDSGIVEASHGKVRKEAAEESEACDDKAKKDAEDKEAAAAAESAAAKAKKEKEEAAAKKKAKETAETVADLKKDKDASVVEDKEAALDDSFELGSPMDDVTLDAAEQDKLSKLFA